MRLLIIILVGLIIIFMGYRLKRNGASPTSLSTENKYLTEFIMESNDYKNEKITLTDEEWKKRLSPEKFYILRKKGTERANTSPLNDNKEHGTYLCGACGLELFSSESKFESGTGWPSFWRPIKPENLRYKDDYKLLSKRVEVLCSRCDSHIGHVFEDGPPPTGLRFCLNGLALDFKPANTEE